MAGPEPIEDDEFPPERPFGVPARPVPPALDEDEEIGGSPRPAPGAQPAARRS